LWPSFSPFDHVSPGDVVLEIGDGDVGVLQVAIRELPARSSSEWEIQARKLPVLVERGRPGLELVPSFDRAIPLRHEVGEPPIFIEVHSRADALAAVGKRNVGGVVVYRLEGDVVVQEAVGNQIISER
jgi:hypothetical protein